MLETPDRVGPVLQTGPLAEAARAAIRELNPQAEFVDRGSYVRVLVPGRCILTRAVLERHAGQRLSFPSDIECIMTSFKGRFSIDEDEACWEASAGP